MIAGLFAGGGRGRVGIRLIGSLFRVLRGAYRRSDDNGDKQANAETQLLNLQINPLREPGCADRSRSAVRVYYDSPIYLWILSNCGRNLPQMVNSDLFSVNGSVVIGRGRRSRRLRLKG